MTREAGNLPLRSCGVKVECGGRRSSSGDLGSTSLSDKHSSEVIRETRPTNMPPHRLTERMPAIRRGMEFIYCIDKRRVHFAEYGSCQIALSHFISVTS